MVQSKVYSVEQIDVPDNFENILKTYAKAVIKTQPYDLLRWSAMYFRCLATDKVPPVKDRLEANCEHGRLTRGYLKVLLRQIGKGFHVTQDTLQDYWKGLCLLEEDLLKFMSLSRMLYWNRIHWLKLFAVMVASLNNNLKDTAIMLCELLSESPEGSSAPIPFWMFKECYTFVAKLDCSREQTFIDSKRLRDNGEFDADVIEPSVPILPDTVTTLIKQIAIVFMRRDDEQKVDKEALRNFQQNVDNLEESLRESGEFDNLISLLNQVVQSGEIYSVVNLMPLRDKRTVIGNSTDESSEAHDVNDDEAEAHLYADQEKILSEIGSLWSWVYQFAQCTSDDAANNKSFNFIASPRDLVAFNENSCQPPEEEPSLANNAKLVADDGGDLLPDVHPPATDANENTLIDTPSANTDDDVIEVGAFLRDAQSKGLFEISDIPSIITFLSRGDAPHVVDTQPLKEYLEQCTYTFQDINELLCGFSVHQNNRQSVDGVDGVDGTVVEEKIVTTSAVKATMSREDSSIDDKENTFDEEKISENDSNIINVFANSGIEADEDLIRAEIAEQMILGLIEKTIRDTEATLGVADVQDAETSTEAPKEAEAASKAEESSAVNESHDEEANQGSRTTSTESESKIHASVETESLADKNDNKSPMDSTEEKKNSAKESRESETSAADAPELDGAATKNGSLEEVAQEVNNAKFDSGKENISEEKDTPDGVSSKIEPSNGEHKLTEVEEGVKKEEATEFSNENHSKEENETTKDGNGEVVKNDEVNKLESSLSNDGSQTAESSVNGGVDCEAKNDHKVTVSDSSGMNEVSEKISTVVKLEALHDSNGESQQESTEVVEVNGNDSVTDSNTGPLVSKSDPPDDEVVKVDDEVVEVTELPRSQSKYSDKSSEVDGKTRQESYSCTVGPILGIGAPVSSKTIESLMEYLRERAREQNGMIYPRNFDEEQCPPLYDDAQ
ncbi:hypothetical protein DMENIID0001_032760 [Sergentomyia squamirostris]